MKRNIFLTLSLLVSLQAQDIKSTISEALSTNPIVLERLNNFQATKQDIQSAKSGYYPKLDLNLGAGYERTKRSNQAGGTDDQTYNFTVYQNSLKLTQNLFDGFSTTYQLEEQEYRTLAAAYSYVEKVNNTTYEVANAYLEVLKNEELLKTAQKNVQIDEDILSKVRKIYKSGLTTLSEVSKIESSLALAKANLVVQENTILEKSFALQKLLGHTLDHTKMTKPDMNVKIPKSKKDALEFALQNNPSLLVSELNIKLAQATNKEKKSYYYPRIDIEISQSMNKNLSGIEGNNDAFRAMAYLSYNIFNGFSDKSAIAKSFYQVQQEAQNKNNAKRQIIETLSLAWASNEKVQEQLMHLQEYNKFSIQTLDLYNKEYSLGRRSLLDLLSTQNDLIRSQEQIITAKYSILSSKYKILDTMGILVNTLMQDDANVYAKVGLKVIKQATTTKGSK
ncbi:TolC family outer membrane protein [Sulfurimonas sp.]|uniref:TolC family outer membrane protein n=1 Tax=Sulfurimonas sp. TaxID=2022749 RepID=UPI00263953F4|nr:TolC family outer membrane protein [Sulfurimonas sp.]